MGAQISAKIEMQLDEVKKKTGTALEDVDLFEFKTGPEKARIVLQKCEDLLRQKEHRTQDKARREFKNIQECWQRIEAETIKLLSSSEDEESEKVEVETDRGGMISDQVRIVIETPKAEPVDEVQLILPTIEEPPTMHLVPEERHVENAENILQIIDQPSDGHQT